MSCLLDVWEIEKSFPFPATPVPSQLNLVGKQFGRLHVLKRVGHRKLFRRKANWLCLCVCGTLKVVHTNLLTSGKTQSCGCQLRESRLGSKRAFRGVGDLSSRKFKTYKRSAENKGRQFNLSLQYCWDLFLAQNKKCALSGIDLVLTVGQSNGKETASLDRIDSSKGYVEGNVQWVHKDINQMKMALAQSYFISLCEKVVKFRGGV